MPPLPLDEHAEARLQELFERYTVSRDLSVRDEIIDKTLWIAARSARRFVDRGEPFDDLLQVARLGLLKAVERFDPAHGVQFGAYATPTILGELRRYFRDHTWSVHVPRRAKDIRSAVNTAHEELVKRHGRSPQISEIADHLRTSPDAVIEALEANNAYRAHPLDPTGSGQITRQETAYEALLNHEVVLQLLDTLRPRERKIIYLRFFEDMSQEQIAAQIGTSQVHVGRLIASTLRELNGRLDSFDCEAATTIGSRSISS